MIFSFLIASVSTEPYNTGPTTIENHCGDDGVVPHSYMVNLKSPLPSDLRSAPTSSGLNTNKGDLSFLHGWFKQYEKDASNGNPRRKLEAGFNSTHAVHYFIHTNLAVAIEASDDVRDAQHAPMSSIYPALRAHLYSHTDPRAQTITLMAKDPAVFSIECDCYSRADVSLLKSKDSSPGAHDTPDLHEVARELSVQENAPWGIDRIDTNGGAIDRSYDDGDLTGKGVRVYIVDTGVQGSHDDFGGRVVNGHTVRAH